LFLFNKKSAFFDSISSFFRQLADMTS